MPRKITFTQGTTILFIGALMVVGVTFHYYAPAPTCRLNIFFIAWTLLMGVVYTFVSARSPPVGVMHGPSTGNFSPDSTSAQEKRRVLLVELYFSCVHASFCESPSQQAPSITITLIRCKVVSWLWARRLRHSLISGHAQTSRAPCMT